MNNYQLKGKLFPFDGEIIDLWVVNGHITYTEPKEYEKFNQDPVFILPGLVDSHVHLSFDKSKYGTPDFIKSAGDPELIHSNLEGHLHAGVLLLRDIGSSGPGTLRLTRNNELPHVIRAGNFLAPENGFPKVIEYVSPDRLPQVAIEQLKQGYDWVKIIGDWVHANPQTGEPEVTENYPQEAVIETVKAVHKAGGKIAMHAQIEGSIETAIEAGVDSLEHGFEMTKDNLESILEKKIIWTPTISALTTSLSLLPKDQDSSTKNYLETLLHNLKETIPLAQQMGIQILAGTDVLPPGNVSFEVNALSNHGLTPLEALKAATISPRVAFNESIFEEGAPADLLLFDSNPIDDLEKLKNPMKIIFSGKAIEH